MLFYKLIHYVRTKLGLVNFKLQLSAQTTGEHKTVRYIYLFIYLLRIFKNRIKLSFHTIF